MTTTNIQIKDGNQLTIITQAVSGGTLHHALIENAGIASQVSTTFVPSSASSTQRYLALTNAKSALGVPMTAAAGTPSGTVGIARTAGTSLQLVGEATNGNAKTDKALFEFNLPDSYVAGDNIPLTINAVVTGAGTLTAASTTMTVTAYTETNGVEAAIAVTAAQEIAATTATDLIFTITGTNLVASQHIVIELAMLVTSASGANTGYINSVSYSA